MAETHEIIGRVYKVGTQVHALFDVNIMCMMLPMETATGIEMIGPAAQCKIKFHGMFISNNLKWPVEILGNVDKAGWSLLL